jgi:Tol biopolymer transport system component
MRSSFVRTFFYFGAALLAGCSDSMAVREGLIPRMTFGAITDSGVVMANADGSGFRVLAPATPGYVSYTTDWDPAGKRLAYDSYGGYGYYPGGIGTVDVNGNATGIGYGLHPEFSPDGAWIYVDQLAYGLGIYRHRGDGSGSEERVGDSLPKGESPSLSPEGMRLVFSAGDGRKLVIANIATGEWSYVDGAIGTSPAWSPDGWRIAYVGSDSASLHTVAPDGSDNRRVGDDGSSYDAGIDWSPDGKWIIVRNATRDRLELIELTTGTVFPLPNTAGYRGPSWRP